MHQTLTAALKPAAPPTVAALAARAVPASEGDRARARQLIASVEGDRPLQA